MQLNDDIKILQQSINMATNKKETPNEKQSTSESSEEGSKPSSPINMVDVELSNNSDKLKTEKQEDEQKIIKSSTDNTSSNVDSIKTTKKRKRKRAKNRSTEKTKKRRKHFSLMQRFSLAQYLNTTLKIRSLNDPNLRCSLKLNLVTCAKEVLATGKDNLKFEYMIEDVKTFVKIVFLRITSKLMILLRQAIVMNFQLC